jgi:signal peptidase I
VSDRLTVQNQPLVISLHFSAKIGIVSFEDPNGGSPESPDPSPQIVAPIEPPLDAPAPFVNGTPMVAEGTPAPLIAPDDPNQERPRSTLAEWTITIILLLFLTTTLVQAYVIPTGSMEDTLLIGDHLLVDKLSFAPSGPVSKYILPYTDVKRGDIIVFRYPVDISQTFVKRCIGVPGDRIRVVNKLVYLNGKALDEPYTYHKTDYIDSYRDNFPGEPNVSVDHRAYEMLQDHVENGDVVVPPNSYFAMGDNRDSSLDSRYWGFVPRENIIGKPLIIYWSYDAPTEQLNNSSISLTHITDLAQNFFSKTRWRRTFQLIHGVPIKSAP